MKTSLIFNLKKKIRLLEKLVYQDLLTRVYNRRGFTILAKKILNELKKDQIIIERRKKFIIKNCSLILFDIDNFKKINDSYGHSIGDKVLKILVAEIKKRIRDIDLIGRWGGEEIIVLLVGADKINALQIANYIREKITKKKIKIENGNFINVTISGGVADFKKEKNFNNVLELADEALYRAKKTGKNKIVMASG